VNIELFTNEGINLLVWVTVPRDLTDIAPSKHDTLRDGVPLPARTQFWSVLLIALILVPSNWCPVRSSTIILSVSNTTADLLIMCPGGSLVIDARSLRPSIGPSGVDPVVRSKVVEANVFFRIDACLFELFID
jgi:hypothetical protein